MGRRSAGGDTRTAGTAPRPHGIRGPPGADLCADRPGHRDLSDARAGLDGLRGLFPQSRRSNHQHHHEHCIGDRPDRADRVRLRRGELRGGRCHVARDLYRDGLLLPAIPRIGQQIATRCRHLCSHRRLCARRTGTDPARRGRHSRAAVCVAVRRHSRRGVLDRESAARSRPEATRRRRPRIAAEVMRRHVARTGSRHSTAVSRMPAGRRRTDPGPPQAVRHRARRKHRGQRGPSASGVLQRRATVRHRRRG